MFTFLHTPEKENSLYKSFAKAVYGNNFNRQQRYKYFQFKKEFTCDLKIDTGTSKACILFN